MGNKGMKFKVEWRKTCKVCGEPITQNRFRTFCSDKCRNKFYQKKYQTYRSEWQRAKYDRNASVKDDKKLKCPICGRYYVQLCSHVLQRHGMTAREFKVAFGYDVKKGRVPTWYKEKKGEISIENKTFLNLKKGKKYWFKKGDHKAGRYQRSPETLARLKTIHKLTKRNKNYAKENRNKNNRLFKV